MIEIRIKAELKQDAKWTALWTALADVGNLANREVEIIADTARRGIAENFEQERAPDGARWEPLAPLTRRQRAEGIDERGVPFRVGQAHPILVRTQDLKRSFVERTHPRNVTRVERGDDMIRVLLSARDDPQTPGRIAKLHSGSGRVPARPFIGLSNRSLARVDEQARRVLAQRLERV